MRLKSMVSYPITYERDTEPTAHLIPVTLWEKNLQ